ncbi:discoidin domain-containing protein [Actinacidiphila acidipaludis]|uniref:Discoidin domain-containing protein n=1 Tax=Actinacidiphila acidipaludis TaxID=2873382 RepID=A0ABS7QEG1_9ACTN|nr:discoidin domain-containing protein [Streptomyces acidipaludis]MBY8880154.1 discoidin domain-containing protein [Streptomyces acidipaludis]
MSDDTTEDASRADGLSRRGMLRSGGAVLAAVSVTGMFAARAAAKPAGAPAGAPPAPGGDLALYRPVTASSTAYGPVPGSFVVDRMAQSGPKGSGWRAADTGTPQWIAVDLEGPCHVTSVVLVFEAAEGDTVYKPADDVNPRNGTTGWEVLSSYATAFRIEVSPDGKNWTAVHEGSTSTGGTVEAVLDTPVTTRWVRMVGTALSNPNPLGLNSFQVLGTPAAHRPSATGWTEWTSGARPVPALRVADDGTLPVESGWNLTLEDFAGTDDGARVSAAGVDTSRWLRAQVPGTILASLVAEGHLPDPVRGFGNLQVPEALSRNSWWYRRTFRLPHDFGGQGRDRVWLELDGINHQAEIWLNGTKAGDLAHPTARASLDVTGALTGHADHVLAVRIDPMPYPGNPGDKGADGSSYADAGSNIMMLNSPNLLAVSGWDWMPAVRDRVMGIWNHVRLRATGDAVLGDVRVDTVLPASPDRSTAEVTVTVPVRNAAASARTVTVEARLCGVRVRKAVQVGAGQSVDAVFAPADFPALRLRNPRLWWPNGYGEPTLHDLQVSAAVAGTVSDTRTVRVGLRETAYASENPITFAPGANHVEQTVDIPAQQARYVRIQGGKRATGFGISLWTLAVVNSADPGTDFALHGAATASSNDNASNTPGNAVDGDPQTRWSSNYTDDQWIQVDLGRTRSFDRLTLVWETAYALTFTVQVSDDGSTWKDALAVDNRPHQLQISVNGVRVMCRGGNWGWDELLRRMGGGRMEAVVGMHRDMNFTMIRNWIGSSNREEFYARCDENGLLVWNDFWNAWFLDPPNHALYLDQVRDTILRYRSHPCIAVWCGANEGTPSGEIDQGAAAAVAAEHPGVRYVSNSAAGVVSGGGPYAWIDPQQYYSPQTYGAGTFGFHTEIGIPTVSVAESMHNLVGDEEGWPISTVWNYHDWSTKGNQYPQNYKAAIDERLGESSSLEEFAAKAQFVNFESMRAMFEAWNANLWKDASGLLLWMSNPAWHSTVWQTYDYDLDVNGSYYGARSGCEAQHVQADPRSWAVIAVNHTAEDLRGAVVTAEVLDLTGVRLAAPQKLSLDVPASGTAPAFTVAAAGGGGPLHLVRLRLSRTDGTVLSENTYWRCDSPGDLKTLNGLSGADLRLTKSRVTVRDGRVTASVTVRNAGKAVAPMVRLGLRGHAARQRILPARYSENYLWLLPGEQRTVTVSCPQTALGNPGDLEVTAQGYGGALVSDRSGR